MKKIYKVMIFLIFIIIYYLYNKNNYSIQNCLTKNGYVMQEYSNCFNNFYIKYYYPVTKYIKLNNCIKYNMEKYINKYYYNENFNNRELLGTYQIYEDNNYLSILYHLVYDFKGAHPETIIYTINYDKINNLIIDIDYLIFKDKEILNKLSKFCYENLKIKFNDYNFLESGISEKKSNFKNFIITKYGLEIYFERYQIAPYSYGESKVLVPLEYLGDDL